MGALRNADALSAGAPHVWFKLEAELKSRCQWGCCRSGSVIDRLYYHERTFPSEARLAQSAERKTLNLVVVGSSPTVGVLKNVLMPIQLACDMFASH